MFMENLHFRMDDLGFPGAPIFGNIHLRCFCLGWERNRVEPHVDQMDDHSLFGSR